LGAFVTNTIGSTWANPLEDISTIFSPQNFPGVPEENVFKLLVQIFGFVPEQAQSQWQHSTRKGQAYREIQGKGQTMFSWLFNVVKTQQNHEVVVEALKAMNSWMKMICICEWPDLSQFIDILVVYCASSVNTQNDRLTELTLEIISGIIGDPNAHQYPSVILNILEKILPLEAALDVVLQKEDAELATSFYGMYVALADCHSKLVVDVCDPENTYNTSNPRNRENCLTLINILLKCTGSPGIYPVDELVSSITISVWYSFVVSKSVYKAK
ncbi:Importin-13, partial [Orchesella cincta]